MLTPIDRGISQDVVWYGVAKGNIFYETCEQNIIPRPHAFNHTLVTTQFTKAFFQNTIRRSLQNVEETVRTKTVI